MADLLTHAIMSQSAKTYSEWMSERIKRGIRPQLAFSRKFPAVRYNKLFFFSLRHSVLRYN